MLPFMDLMLIFRKKEITNGLVGLQTGGGGQPKEKRDNE